MKSKPIIFYSIGLVVAIFFSGCGANIHNEKTHEQKLKTGFGGFENQVKWGEHLVTIAGCNDCHTQKKFGPHGMEIDSALLLSGHPAQLPVPSVDRKDIESRGLVVTNTLTSWVGPWGISYSANLTSDPTGIGNWEEENFINALRMGKYKGIPEERALLPPMPWQMYQHMTDDEIKAIFAYLKSTKPISNLVPEIQAPVSAPGH